MVSRQATSPPNVRAHSTIAGKSNRADKSAVFGEPAIELRHQTGQACADKGQVRQPSGQSGATRCDALCPLNDSPGLAGHLHTNEEHGHKKDQTNCRDERSCCPSPPEMTFTDAVERPCRYRQDAGPRFAMARLATVEATSTGPDTSWSDSRSLQSG